MVKIGINGFGRIGRCIFRIAMRYQDNIEIVGINDVTDSKTLAHLLKYDSVFGKLDADVTFDADHIIVDGKPVRVFKEKDAAKIDWAGLGTQIVVESSGKYTDANKARVMLGGSVQKIVITAPATNDDMTIVQGVNENLYDPAVHNIVSSASCTTNGLAVILDLLDKTYGVVRGMTTAVHAYTNDQKILDVSHKDLRRARAAAQSIIPTTTGAAKAIAKVLPRFADRMSCYAVRVPTPDVSIIDIVVELKKSVTTDELNETFRQAAAGKYKGILGCSDEELVSIDYRGNENTTTIDTLLTMTMEGGMAKIVAWYDNEWGYACRVVDLVRFMAEKGL
jgi:glyceraldehyde 3-phosphate dehydrogenase